MIKQETRGMYYPELDSTDDLKAKVKLFKSNRLRSKVIRAIIRQDLNKRLVPLKQE